MNKPTIVVVGTEATCARLRTIFDDEYTMLEAREHEAGLRLLADTAEVAAILCDKGASGSWTNFFTSARSLRPSAHRAVVTPTRDADVYAAHAQRLITYIIWLEETNASIRITVRGMLGLKAA